MSSTEPATTVAKQEAKDPGPQSKSLRQIIPWTGFVSLLVMIFCAITSAIVISVSQGKHPNTWSIQPSVILAVISAISNVAFNSARATGIAVRFWLYAWHDAHLSQLHYIWDHGRGYSFLSALRVGSEARTVAVLATVAYITQFASGLLLQRSVTQIVLSSEDTQSLYMDVAKRIPDSWFGPMDGDYVVGFLMGFRNNRQPSGIVRCILEWTRATFAMGPVTATLEWYLRLIPPEPSTLKNQPYLLLTALYASDVNTSCITTLTITTCNIDAAEVEYPVKVENSAITLGSDELTSMRVVSTYTSDLDFPNQPNGADSGPLAGLAGLVGQYGNPLRAKVNKISRQDLNRTVYGGRATTLADQLIQVQTPASADPHGPMRKCALTWASPTDHRLKYMHEFMFRSALRLGMNGTGIIGAEPNGISEHQQTLVVRRITPMAVFSVDPAYLGAAIVLTILAIGLVVSLMWGWWRLRRPVTLSPLETVTALADAPELRDMPADTTLKQILKKVDTAPASGSIRSGEQPRSPPGFGLCKSLTGRSNSSSQHGGVSIHRPVLKKASTSAGPESITGIPSRPRLETQPSNLIVDWEPVQAEASPTPLDAPAAT